MAGSSSLICRNSLLLYAAKNAKDAEKAEKKVKAQQSKSDFARIEYQLELAAANARYRRFRDGQCPEVMQVRRWSLSF